MTEDSFNICGVDFAQPYLFSFFSDLWLSRVEMLVREDARYANADVHYHRFIFEGGLEFRGAKSWWDSPNRLDSWHEWLEQGRPYTPEEVTDYQEEDANRTLLPPHGSTYGASAEGLGWLHKREGALRMVTLVTWTMAVEFIFGGPTRHEALSAQAAAAYWRAGFERNRALNG